VSRKVAGAFGPFDGWLTIGLAVRSGCILQYSITSLAGLDNGVTSSTIVGATVLLHENTLHSSLDRFANNDTQPPFLMSIFLISPK